MVAVYHHAQKSTDQTLPESSHVPGLYQDCPGEESHAPMGEAVNQSSQQVAMVTTHSGWQKVPK